MPVARVSEKKGPRMKKQKKSHENEWGLVRQVEKRRNRDKTKKERESFRLRGEHGRISFS